MDAQFHELIGGGEQAGLADAAGKIQSDLHHGHMEQLVLARRIVAELLQFGGKARILPERVTARAGAKGKAALAREGAGIGDIFEFGGSALAGVETAKRGQRDIARVRVTVARAGSLNTKMHHAGRTRTGELPFIAGFLSGHQGGQKQGAGDDHSFG